MNARKAGLVMAATMLFSSGALLAQEENTEEEAETTIRLMGNAEAELPSAVTDPIALPESVPEDSAAVENAQEGIDTANANRARREAGLTTADEAREKGAQMAEDAMQNRESRGRSGDLPEPPAPPQVPGPPTPPNGS